MEDVVNTMHRQVSAQSASTFQSPLKNSNHAFIGMGCPAQVTPQAPQQVAFILLDHFSMSSFSVALDTIVTTNLVHSSPIYQIKTYALSQSRALSDLSIELPTDATLEELQPDQNTLLVVCGGYRNRLVSLPKLNAKLAEAKRAGATLCGIWNGAFYLADASVLDNEQVAIHQDNLALMLERFPDLPLAGSAYTVASRHLTCAGPNSVLNMMLEYIGATQGHSCAQAVEEVIGRDREAVVGEQTTPSPATHPQLPEVLKDAIRLVENNVEEPLSIEELATLVGISRRQIERLFRRHLGVAPARYYMEYRLTRARQLLQQSNLSITEISVACGFVSPTHFSRSYRRFFNQPPIDARRRQDQNAC